MFEDSLLERRITAGHRRGWTTVISFFIEGGLLGVLILLPLIFTDALPTHQLVTYLVAPAPPPPPPPPPAATPAVVRTQPKVVSEISDTGALRAPTRIPKKVEMVTDAEPPAATAGVIGGVPGGVPGGQLGGVIGGILRATPVAHLPKPPVSKSAVPKRVRVSQGVTEGLLLHKVMPTYPAIARSARIQGTVVLTAIIGKNGTIENLQLKSGHPMLAPAAINAVSQWQYKPYLLNGQPVEVETTITVNFTLAG